MKINKLQNTKSKLIKLKLIQTKIYKKSSKNPIKINDIIPRIKKAIFLIYKYHINNKKILFVGTPLNSDNKFKKLFKNTNHIFIPESMWVNGILTNKESCFSNLTKNQNSNGSKLLEVLLPLKQQSDLIVVLNSSSNPNVLKEAYTIETPIISLNNDLSLTEENYSYKIPGNFIFTKKKIRDNFFYSILDTTFKKANRIKSYLKKIRIKENQKKSNNKKSWEFKKRTQVR